MPLFWQNPDASVLMVQEQSQPGKLLRSCLLLLQEQGQPGVLTRKMMQNVMHGRFSWPRGVQVSIEVRDLVR